METWLVPNEISYTTAGKVQRWGHQIKLGQEKLDHLQLLLWYPPKANIEKLIPNTKAPIDVIADYLSCLREHTIAAITRMYGAPFLKATPVDWVFTVPDVWISCPVITIPLSHFIEPDPRFTRLDLSLLTVLCR